MMRSLLLLLLLPPGAPMAAEKPTKLLGVVAKIPWQHPIAPVEGKRHQYFDVDGGGQVVVYVAKPLDCPGKIELTGKWLRFEAGSKRPGSKATAQVEQFEVDSWRCLP